MTLAQLKALIRPLEHRLRAIAARVTIKRVNDTAGLQSTQLTALAGEVLEAVQRLQQFGFTANPPVGSTGLIVCLGGSRSAPVLLGVEHPASRLRGLEPGESAMYNAFGDYAKFKKDGTLEVQASKEAKVTSPIVTINAATRVHVTSPEVTVSASTKVLLDTPLTECTGALKVNGAFTALDAVTFGTVASSVTFTLNGSLNGTGDLHMDGQVSDGTRSMQEMVDEHNDHAHMLGGFSTSTPNTPMT